jgi:homoserine kinase
VRARAPASSANLGPGFDALALAVDRFVEVEVERASRLIVRSEGEGAGLNDDAGHLAARVAIDVVGHDRLAVTVRSQIPVSRGLGSSAALAAAAAAAAGSRDPLTVAARTDGHPENAAASVVGGLVVASTVRGKVMPVEMPFDPHLVIVAMVPDRSLSTTRARQLLPTQIGLADATFNLGRMGLLLAGLADHRLLVKEAGEDRLHQDYRSPLFPEAPMLLAALVAGGALMACWSGAGPTLLGFCADATGPRLEKAAKSAMADAGVPGRVMLLHAERAGLVTGDAARLPALADDGTIPPIPRAAPPIPAEPDAVGPSSPTPGSPRGVRATGGTIFDFDERS